MSGREKIIPDYKEIQRWRKENIGKNKSEMSSNRILFLIVIFLSVILYFMWFKMEWFNSDTIVLFSVIALVDILLIWTLLFGKNPEELSTTEIQKSINMRKKWEIWIGKK